jgi:pimeloyl-ACP methyl ester carboxylesterase
MGIGRLLTGASIASALLAIASTAVAQETSPPAVDQTLAAYADAKDFVRLPNGRTIHLVCMGQGSPVVILTTGGNGWSIGWNLVQPALATRTRACAWDRAGFGLSTPGPKPQTVDETTTDLEAALKAARIAGPYVVVGASLGGLESLLLADRQPRNVVGMVLVDPSFPDQTSRQNRAAPALMEWDQAHPPPFIPLLQKCAAALRAGTLRYGGPDPDGCLHPQWPPSYPPELRAALDRGQAEAPPELIASAMETMVSAPQLGAADSKIVIKPDRNYGNMPLVVLTASDIQLPPDLPDAARAEVPSVQAEWRRAHEELAALSSRGVDRLVPGSTHDIAHVKPQVVIDAIDEVVDAARASGRKAAR